MPQQPQEQRTLIYITGASGSGKDSIINFARERIEAHKVIFAHRYITRTVSAGGENHIALTEHEFKKRLKYSVFAMHWQSHGLYYGIGCEIDLWLKKGFKVVVNGSRAYLPCAVQKYPHLIPVLITVSPEVLRQRLTARGRENESQIEKRLQRASKYPVKSSEAIHIDNNTSLEKAGNCLLKLLT